HRHSDLRVEILAAAFELTVRQDTHAEKQIPRGATMRARFAFTRFADLCAVLHTCRNADVDRARASGALDSDTPRRAGKGLLECLVHGLFEIASAPLTWPVRAPRAGARLPTAEKGVEEIGEGIGV